jgi:hypothetical protein
MVNGINRSGARSESTARKAGHILFIVICLLASGCGPGKLAGTENIPYSDVVKIRGGYIWFNPVADEEAGLLYYSSPPGALGELYQLSVSTGESRRLTQSEYFVYNGITDSRRDTTYFYGEPGRKPQILARDLLSSHTYSLVETGVLRGRIVLDPSGAKLAASEVVPESDSDLRRGLLVDVSSGKKEYFEFPGEHGIVLGWQSPHSIVSASEVSGRIEVSTIDLAGGMDEGLVAFPESEYVGSIDYARPYLSYFFNRSYRGEHDLIEIVDLEKKIVVHRLEWDGKDRLVDLCTFDAASKVFLFTEGKNATDIFAWDTGTGQVARILSQCWRDSD